MLGWRKRQKEGVRRKKKLESEVTSCTHPSDPSPPWIAPISSNRLLVLHSEDARTSWRRALESGDGGACIGNGSHIQIPHIPRRRFHAQMRISHAPVLAVRIFPDSASYRKTRVGGLLQRPGVGLLVAHRDCMAW